MIAKVVLHLTEHDLDRLNTAWRQYRKEAEEAQISLDKTNERDGAGGPESLVASIHFSNAINYVDGFERACEIAGVKLGERSWEKGDERMTCDHDFRKLSTCCGAPEHGSAEGFCGQCHDATGFELVCSECGELAPERATRP